MHTRINCIVQFFSCNFLHMVLRILNLNCITLACIDNAQVLVECCCFVCAVVHIYVRVRLSFFICNGVPYVLLMRVVALYVFIGYTYNASTP